MVLEKATKRIVSVEYHSVDVVVLKVMEGTNYAPETHSKRNETTAHAQASRSDYSSYPTRSNYP